MIVDSLKQIPFLKSKLRNSSISYEPKIGQILMADPSGYEVKYAINPHMQDKQGRLNAIDKEKARDQWLTLKNCYEHLGFKVSVIDGPNDLPDFVFAANQSFPFKNLQTQKTQIIPSQMFSQFRRKEVDIYASWYAHHDYETLAFSSKDVFFEGNGDALIDLRYPLIWGGYGPRTSKNAYEEVEHLTGYDVIRLPLTSPECYHLDTCFSILGENTVAIYPQAFTPEGLNIIREMFRSVIEISPQENAQGFAANCHCPNGRDVIVHSGNTQFNEELRLKGFNLIEVDTSEYIKSGGSVFCMKMAIWA